MSTNIYPFQEDLKARHPNRSIDYRDLECLESKGNKGERCAGGGVFVKVISNRVISAGCRSPLLPGANSATRKHGFCDV